MRRACGKPQSAWAAAVRVLALDTATAASTVAFSDGAERMFTSEDVVGTGHAERIAAQVIEVLDEARCPPGSVDVVAVGVGPGPYTSTRVGVALAQAFGLAVGAPVVGVCTLDVIAEQHASGERFGVATDARRNEIYWATYDEAGQRTMGPRVGRPEEVLAGSDIPATWCGNGFERFSQIIREHGIRVSEPRFPSAASLLIAARRLLDRASCDRPGDAGREPGTALVEVAGRTVPLVGGRRPLDSHAGDGSVTDIPARGPLAPRPLYLRRPDAKPPRDLDHLPEVRPMRWPDIASVTSLESRMFGKDAWSVETFWSELAGVPDRRTYLVTETREGVVGYGGMAWSSGNAGPTADLQTLAVSPESRRQGSAKRMLGTLLDEARRRGCVECLLEVRADNMAAIHLYESAGFAEIARRTAYYRDGADAVIMRLDVREGP